MMTKDSSMFFKLKGSKNTLVGVTDSYGELSTLKVNLKLQEGRDSVDYDYIVETMVPQIFEILDKYKFLKTKDGETTWNSTIYIVQDNHIYEIIENGGVLEHDEIATYGQGEGFILGSLYTSKDNPDIMDRIKKALAAACKYEMYNNYPFVVIDSKTLDYTVIKKEVF